MPLRPWIFENEAEKVGIEIVNSPRTRVASLIKEGNLTGQSGVGGEVDRITSSGYIASQIPAHCVLAEHNA